MPRSCPSSGMPSSGSSAEPPLVLSVPFSAICDYELRSLSLLILRSSSFALVSHSFVLCLVQLWFILNLQTDLPLRSFHAIRIPDDNINNKNTYASKRGASQVGFPALLKQDDFASCKFRSDMAAPSRLQRVNQWLQFARMWHVIDASHQASCSYCYKKPTSF